MHNLSYIQAANRVETERRTKERIEVTVADLRAALDTVLGADVPDAVAADQARDVFRALGGNA